jgi:hypothetical protein
MTGPAPLLLCSDRVLPHGPRKGILLGLSLGSLSQLGVLPVKSALSLYRLIISPLFGPTCRFYPSCSSYALEAVDKYGICKGLYLAVVRLSKCHPWHPGGFDPVREL